MAIASSVSTERSSLAVPPQSTWLRRARVRQWHQREHERLERLVAERTAELSALTSHLHSVVEREKSDLARELHDELGSILTVARMDLDWLQRRYSASDPEIGNRLRSLAQNIEEAMDVKHRVVENLRPALLDHFGLPVALKSHFEGTCQKAGLTCKAQVPDACEGISSEVAIALFRVAQESLTNIIRHARASNVVLRFESDLANHRIGIDDDGVGFDQAQSGASRSHGLVGMRHRIHTLGGQFSIQPNQPRGTRVNVAVPRACCG